VCWRRSARLRGFSPNQRSSSRMLSATPHASRVRLSIQKIGDPVAKQRMLLQNQDACFNRILDRVRHVCAVQNWRFLPFKRAVLSSILNKKVLAL